MRRIAGASLTIVLMVAAAAGVLAQAGTPADVAAKISGTWKLNLELSPGVTPNGRSGGRGRSGLNRAAFAVSPALLQRGGRGGGGGGAEPGSEASAPLPPEEIAAQRVLQGFQQIPTDVTIVATADTVTLKENSGQGTFEVNGKTIEIPIDGAKIKARSKWDRAALKQEFWSVRRKVVRTWTVDPAGHLVLTMKIETLMKIPETRAVFDRQP